MIKLISFTCPDVSLPVIEKMDAYVAANDTSRSKFIREAIEAKLAALEIKKRSKEPA
jgi:metal-responsive CopG/Arc/MetJ family transcriptional regulator